MASDIARRDVPICSLDDRLGQIRKRTKDAGMELCVVVNDEEVVLGLLRQEELRGPDDKRAEDAMRSGPSTFRPHVPIAELSHYMSHHNVESAPITRSDGSLMGIVFIDDAKKAAAKVR